MDKGALLAADRTRFLNNYNLSESVVLICARRLYRADLRNQGVYFRLQPLHAGHDVGVFRLVTFPNCRFRHLARGCLTICVVGFYSNVQRIVACITRVNYSRRNVTSDVGRRVYVTVSRRTRKVFRTSAARPRFSSLRRAVCVRARAGPCLYRVPFFGSNSSQADPSSRPGRDLG